MYSESASQISVLGATNKMLGHHNQTSSLEAESDNQPTQYIDRKKLLSSGSSPEIEFHNDPDTRQTGKEIERLKAKTINRFKEINRN